MNNDELWKKMQIKPDKLGFVISIANKILKNRSRYEDIQSKTGVPWWWVAAVHSLEAGLNFSCHLHNGDPLVARTKHVPKGRPLAEPENGSCYSWEESCIDALKSHNLCNLDNWSISNALERLELYNGLGYRRKGKPSPYLWSFSNQYQRGKYTEDGVYDSTVVSTQCGGAVIIRHLANIGAISFDDDSQVADGPALTMRKAIATSPTAGAVGTSAVVSFFTLVYTWLTDMWQVVSDAGSAIITTKSASGPFSELIASLGITPTRFALAIILGCSIYAFVRHISKKISGDIK